MSVDMERIIIYGYATMVLKNIHSLIPRTCEHVILPGKRESAGVSKFTPRDEEIILY